MSDAHETNFASIRRTSTLSREQVESILAKLAAAEVVADKRNAECIANDGQSASGYFRGQGNGLFRAACLIRETMDEEKTMSEDKQHAENLGSSAQLNRVCKRAGELAEMKMRELRLVHPDNIDGTFSGQQWRGVGRSRLIQDILFEEFCSNRWA